MMDVLLKLEPVRLAAYMSMFTVVDEMQGEMAGTPSTSGSHACCRAAFLPAIRAVRSKAITCTCHGLQWCVIMYIRTLCMHPVLILVTRPSCVNLVNSIKSVGNSRSYLPYCHSHYVLLRQDVG